MSHKLLLADDSVTIQRVIELTFAGEDVQVIAVGDGQQAIDRIGTERPDIVLADIGMPERDGYEVGAFVKGDPHLKHIPVVLLTGAFEPVDEARARAIGCDGVLVKPFEPQLVINRVRDLLAGRRPAALWATPWGGHPSSSDSGASPQSGRLPTALRPSAAAPRSSSRVPSSPSVNPAPPLSGAQPASAKRPPPTQTTADPLEEYFERIDTAFADIEGGPPPVRSHQTDGRALADERGREASQSDGRSLKEELQDWDLDAFGAEDSAPGSPGHSPAQDHLTLSTSADFQSGLAAPVEQPAETDAPPPPAEASSAAILATAPTAVPAPPLADAFAALLAAEQGGPPSFSLAQPVQVAAPTIANQLVEELTKRVLDRVTDQVVRDAVAATVSEVAERLVRAELERIKASAK